MKRYAVEVVVTGRYWSAEVVVEAASPEAARQAAVTKMTELATFGFSGAFGSTLVEELPS